MRIVFFIFSLFLVSSVHCFEAEASNRVKVVTIGGGGALVDAGTESDYQKLVDKVIAYWKRELNRVLIYKPDIIVLTEACDRPGGLNAQKQFDYFEVRKNQVQNYFSAVAKENRCYIAFGTKHEIDGVWRNSCVVLDREGQVAGMYHKNYPTIPEMLKIKPSTETPLIQCDFGTVGSVICFDLNFDELRDRYAALKPDILLFPSMYHGGLEQAKWAYSCRSFFVCAHGLRTAPSEIRNPLGEIVATSTNYFPYAVATINLDRKLVHLDNNWEKLTALQKKYGDKVVVSDPGQLGAVLITSEHEEVSVDEMIKEFEIELLDDYFNRSRQDRLRQLKLVE
ncbi:MAG: carbon-nitrogen hydrolase family protein [Planctomycetaceae bacterium]|nr:carbon-nitrogen hydrolase family protein [Planctomycetaceae bacterium]